MIPPGFLSTKMTCFVHGNTTKPWGNDPGFLWWSMRFKKKKKNLLMSWLGSPAYPLSKPHCEQQSIRLLHTKQSKLQGLLFDLQHFIGQKNYTAWTSGEANLLWLGVPAFGQQAVEAAELNLLWTAQRWSDAFGELLRYLKLVQSQCGPAPSQQLIQHHTIGEHVHL